MVIVVIVIVMKYHVEFGLSCGSPSFQTWLWIQQGTCVHQPHPEVLPRPHDLNQCRRDGRTHRIDDDNDDSDSDSGRRRPANAR